MSPQWGLPWPDCLFLKRSSSVLFEKFNKFCNITMNFPINPIRFLRPSYSSFRFPPPACGNHVSAFCLSSFAFSGHFIQMELQQYMSFSKLSSLWLLPIQLFLFPFPDLYPFLFFFYQYSHIILHILFIHLTYYPLQWECKLPGADIVWFLFTCVHLSIPMPKTHRRH